MALFMLIGALASESRTEDFAKAVFSALGLSDYGRRNSTHYEEGVYYQAKQDRIIIDISIVKEYCQDLPYWIAIRHPQAPEEDLTKIVESSIVPQLIANGFRLARFESFGRLDEVRIDY